MGDESWTIEMDALFTNAADAFLAGDLNLARESYGRLMDAFDLDQEVGTFCGPSNPCDMVTTGIPEAVARYLRAAYETTPTWIEILTANTSGYWARDRRRLLTEATACNARNLRLFAERPRAVDDLDIAYGE